MGAAQARRIGRGQCRRLIAFSEGGEALRDGVNPATARWAALLAPRFAGMGRVGRISVVAVAAVAAVLAAIYAGLSWHLSQRPIPLSFLNDRISDAVSSALPEGFGVRIAETLVESDPGTGRIQLSLRDVAALDGSGKEIFSAPRAAFRLSPGALLTGRIVPEGLWLVEPSVTLVRSSAGLALPGREAAARLPDTGPAETLAAVVGWFAEAGGLEVIGIRDGALSIVDHDGATQRLDDVTLTVERGNGVAFALQVGRGTGAPELAGTLRREGGNVVVDIDLRDIAASDLGPLVPPGLAQVFSGPVSGDVVARVKPSGNLEAASAHIVAGAGHIGGAGAGLLVDEADLSFSWSQATRRLVIEPSTVLSGYNRATIAGEIVLPERDEFNYGTVPLRLSLSDVSFKDPAGGRGAEYSLITLDALYLAQQGVLHIGRLDVAANDGAMSFVGIVGGSGGSPGIQLAGTMLPVPYDALADLWPPFLDPETRRWVIDHLSAGRMTDVRLSVDIPPDVLAAALRGVPLPASAYLLEFGMDDVVFRYLGDMPPISGARGKAALTPQSFELRMDPGSVVQLGSGETVTVGNGHFRVPDVRAKPSTGHVSLDLAGSASAVLRLFDHHPIEIAKGRGFDPSAFSGDAELNINLAIPMLREVHLSDVDLRVDGRIANLSASGFHAGRSISDAEVTVSVVDGRILIVGQGLVDGVPAEIAVDESLDGSGAGGGQSVTMSLDDSARRHLGIGLDGILTGPVTATVADLQASAAGTSQRIEADLTAARIDFPLLGIEKPAGAAATARFLLKQDGDSVRLSELSVESDAIQIAGEVEFDKSGGLVRLELPTVRTAYGTDVSVTGRSEGGADVFELRGKAIDFRPSLRGLSSLAGPAGATAPASDGGGRTQVEFAVDALIGLNGERLSDVRGTVTRRGESPSRIALNGRTSSGSPVALRFVDESSNGEVAADTEDGGRLLAWSGLYENMRGGRLSLAASRRARGEPLTGRLVITGFAVADDPSLARLIASGEQGARQYSDSAAPADRRRRVNPSNVGFHTLSVPFAHAGSRVRISDGVLRGPAVGATLEGTVHLAEGHMSLNGTYVPFYEINNLFGQLPLFGPLLGGRRNEGLLGITYSVSGALDSPVLTVNPLSFVTPGLFRYILGMDNPRAAGAPRNSQNERDPAAR